MNQPALFAFIWSVADLLRRDDKQSEHGRVILPFTVLRRVDCVLESTKSVVLEESRVGSEIPFNRHCYVFQPPRPLEAIDANLKGVIGHIQAMLGEVMG